MATDLSTSPPNPTGKAPKPKGARLGTRLRGKLAGAYDERGHHHSNLWYVYSPKARVDVVLRSDVEFGHFLLVESEPNIVDVDYSPEKRIARIAGEDFGTIVDAELTLRGGTRVWREVKRSEDVEQGAQTRANLQLMVQMKAAALVGVTHELITDKQVFAQPQRIHNWLRIVAWLSQARFHPLEHYTRAVLKIIKTRSEVRLADIAALGPAAEMGLFCAAAFQVVQKGLVGSDLDVLPLTWQSRLFLVGEAP